VNVFAQQDTSDTRQILKKAIKKKFIENLGLDKESADKFFRLYNETRKDLNELTKKQKEIIEYINTNYDSPDISAKIDEMIENENKIFETRKNFIISLREFLTPQQIAKSIVMQQKMRKLLSDKPKE
jgi:Spy/CpxP family protein refolding chaperone